MNTATTFQSNNRNRIAAMLIYLFICLFYTVVFMYAAYILFAGAEKLVAYFNGCIAAANDQINYCLR
jgi:O-antigen/teichoic acid export membrane protein